MNQRSIEYEYSGFDGISDVKPLPTEPENPYRFISQSINFQPVFGLFRMYQRGNIISRTFFNRKDNWDFKKKSRFIESLMLEFPVPVICVMDKLNVSDREWEIIDGQNRLDAILHFLNNQFSLSGLEILKELNDKRFDNFEAASKRKIQDHWIPVLVISNLPSTGICMEIFKRFNL